MLVDHDHCSQCRSALVPGVAHGLCPTCLLEQALLPEPSLQSAPGVGENQSASGSPGAAELNATSRSLPRLPGGRGPRQPLARALPGMPGVRWRDLGYDGPELAPVSLSGQPALPCDDDSRVELFGEIARGGMGTVLRGRDLDLGRELAVKVLKEAHADRPELVRRFIEEAQIAGQLQHPGIAPVYELGVFADRRPYFTMKLVRGKTLAVLFKERSGPGRDLACMLGIFEHVCQTLAYAHARGVIHRDLKPSNIMVGGFGEVQVMDWGLAKVLRGSGDEPGRPSPGDADGEGRIRTLRSDGAEDLSHHGSVLGTPAYLSPEQARGQIDAVDARADVFGLGAILCEMLTGAPPYPGPTSADSLRQATEGDLADARRRLDECGADQELIELAGHCLSPDPADRPPHAGAIAQRVTAYLRGVQERLHRAEVAAVKARARAARLKYAVVAVVSLALLFTGIGAGVYVRAREARDRHLRFENALAGADQLLQRVTDASTSRIVPASEWDQVRAVLDSAASLLPADAPEGLRARADRLRAQAHAEHQAAHADQRLLDDLLAIRGAQADPHVDADAGYADTFLRYGHKLGGAQVSAVPATLSLRPAPVRRALAMAIDDWTLRRRAMGDVPGAARLVAAARGLDDDERRGKLRDLLERTDLQTDEGSLLELAASADPAEWTASSLTLLAGLLSIAGEHQAAVDLLERSLGRHAQDMWVHHMLGTELLAVRPARREQALRFLTAARAIRPESGFALAGALKASSRPDEAKAVMEDLVARVPTSSLYLTRLAELEGPSDRGFELVDRAIGFARKRVELVPADVSSHYELGLALWQAGETQPAIEAYRAALRLKPDHCFAHADLALALESVGDWDGGLAALGQAVRLDPENAWYHGRIATHLWRMDRKEEAIAAIREAIRLQPDDSAMHSMLALALRSTGDLPGSLHETEEARRLDPDGSRGRAIQIGGRPGAITVLRRRVAAVPEDSRGWAVLGLSCWRSGRLEEAEAAFLRALQIKSDAASVQDHLGELYHRMGRKDEAIAACREAFRLDSRRLGARDRFVAGVVERGKLSPLDAWLEVVSLHPELTSSAEGVVEVLAAQAQLDQALQDCQARLPARAEFAPFYRHMGSVLRTRGFEQQGVEAYRAALRIDSQDGAAHALLALACAPGSDAHEAVAGFGEAIRCKPAASEITPAFLLRLADAPRHLHVPAVELLLSEQETSVQSDQFRAILLLAVGEDPAAYARICRRLMQDHEVTDNSMHAEQVARTCALSPLSGVEPTLIVTLAQRSLRRRVLPGCSHYTLGLAYFRAGRYQEAIEALEGSMTGAPDWPAIALNWPVLAMAHARLGHREEALGWLDRSETARIPHEPYWNDPLELSVLVAEARAGVK